jgi:hypothetical protein
MGTSWNLPMFSTASATRSTDMPPPQGRRSLRTHRRHPHCGHRPFFRSPEPPGIASSRLGQPLRRVGSGRIDIEALRGLLARHPLAGSRTTKRPSTPWTRACGPAVTRSLAPYSRLLLPPVKALGWPADRRRLGLPVHRPDRLRPRELDSPLGGAPLPGAGRQRGGRRAGESVCAPLA